MSFSWLSLFGFGKSKSSDMESSRKKTEDEDGFIKVWYKRRNSRPRPRPGQAAASDVPTPSPEHIQSHLDLAVFAKRLARTVYEIQESENMKQFERILERTVEKFGKKMIYPSRLTTPLNLADGLQKFAAVDDIFRLDVVCYGLGRFLSSPAARTQLALLIILGVAHSGSVYVYDPVFCEKEKEILRLLSMNVLPSNEEGKHTVSRPTIFFMPYCPHELYNNLLWANWSADKLSQLAIIGNSFRVIVDDIPSRILLQDNRYLYNAVKFTEETLLPFSFSQYFHGLSIHTFNAKKLNEMPDVMWLNNEEPVYEFTEMITCK